LGFQIARIVVVMALLCVAAAISTPKGRLPLALRGVYRIMRRDRGDAPDIPKTEPVSAWRRLLAFFLVLIAVIAAVV
jgi:hypothetical protein